MRLATAADIRAMISLERQCETAAHWSEGQYRSALPACGSALTARLMLVVEGGSEQLNAGISVQNPVLSGFLVARHQGPEWELENIVVAPAFRRQGVGVRLLNGLRELARAADSECVYLEVRESNQAARRFYAKSGFEEIGRRKGYYAGPAEDAILCRLMLRQGSTYRERSTENAP